MGLGRVSDLIVGIKKNRDSIKVLEDEVIDKKKVRDNLKIIITETEMEIRKELGDFKEKVIVIDDCIYTITPYKDDDVRIVCKKIDFQEGSNVFTK